jgi:acetoin utilization protein AcuC
MPTRSPSRGLPGPLLVFGPRSLEYDFGPTHPLSPRRFGPGIELLRAVGAEPGLAPVPASDEELGWLHSADYIATVRRISAAASGASNRRAAGLLSAPEAGIGPGDDPAFPGMHEAAATVAGGSIRAVEAILRGDVEHAFQPGGGLHHAMAARASGFCIYNDVALAIARARRDGLRVLYLDFDVHHGDGVQALHYADPGVMKISFHESGRSLFPGTGFIDEVGEGMAAGTSINVPLEAYAGPDAWLAAVEAIVRPLAAAFGPDIVVSQHGSDGHVWDPLAHLSLTTTVQGKAARLVDRIAHLYSGGRWLATGGGGYAVYRVVPRVWALTWLAGAHLETPAALPDVWREKWAGDADRWHEAPLPDTFDDAADLPPADSISESASERATATVNLVRTVLVPALLSVAEDRGWWRFGEGVAPTPGGAAPAAEAPPATRATPLNVATPTTVASPAVVAASTVAAASAPTAGIDPTVIVPLTPAQLDRLSVAPRVIAPSDTATATAILHAALLDGATAVAAVAGEWLIGVALAAASPIEGVDRLVALGVAPEWRRRGVATSMLRALVGETDRRGRALVALHVFAERDPMDPLPRALRRGVAEKLALGAAMGVAAASGRVAAADPGAFVAVHLPPAAPQDIRARIGEWLARL